MVLEALIKGEGVMQENSKNLLENIQEVLKEPPKYFFHRFLKIVIGVA